MFFCFIGLSQDRIKTYFNNSNTIELKSKKIDIKNKKDIFFTNIIRLSYVDDILIISDQDPDYNMKILNLETGYLRKFGRKGRGPNEMQRNMSFFSVDYLSNKLYVSDLPFFYVYSVQNLKSNISDDPISKINVPNDRSSSFLSSTYLKGKIVGNTYGHPFEVFNIKTKSNIGKFEYKNGDALVNQSNFFSHPFEDKVVSLGVFSDNLCVYTINGNTIQQKEQPWDQENSKVKTKTVGKEKKKTYAQHSKLGFLDGTTSGKYIFTLYSGKSYSDSESFFQASTTNLIYVFNWDAKPIKKYKLDVNVRSISYDNKNSILYASCYDDFGIPYIVKFDLEN